MGIFDYERKPLITDRAGFSRLGFRYRIAIFVPSKTPPSRRCVYPRERLVPGLVFSAHRTVGRFDRQIRE